MAIPYIVCRKVDATKKEKPQLWYAVGKKMQKKSGRTERDVAHRVAQRTGFHPGVVEAVLAATGENGCEHIVGYAFAGEYVGDYPQCIKKEKAIVSIQATTDSLIYYASAQEITNFFSTDKSTQELEKILAEELFVQTYKRLLDIYCKTPTELYVDLVRRYPDFLNYITLREIASFLRVTPETISHIRKNIKGIGFC